MKRFEDKITKLPNGCWQWNATINRGGYGLFWYQNKMISAHRFSYELYVGKIPNDLCIDHLCRNRACVNPAHMDIVSNFENTLRGQNFIARHVNATHCPKGHEYSTANTYRYPDGRRECRTCSSAYKRAYRERNK